MQKYVVIVAGGQGSRMGADIPKQFITLEGKPILMYTIKRFAETVPNAKLIVVLPKEQIPTWEKMIREYNFKIAHTITAGGETRFHSVKNGLQHTDYKGLVAIHDGVRPFVDASVIEQAFETAQQKGNAIPAVALKDSIRSVNGEVNQAEDRSLFKLIQTPQTFQTDIILEAFKTEYIPTFTDDASVAEYAGHKMILIEGNYENIKLTTPEDLKIAKAFL